MAIPIKLSAYLYTTLERYKIYFISLFLVAISAAVLNLATSYKIKEIIDTIQGSPETDIFSLLVLFVIFKFMQHMMFFIQRLLNIRYKPKLLAEIVADMYTRTLKHSLHWFDSHLSGEISTKISDFQSNSINLITYCFKIKILNC
jgi:ATP-binding cassette subfamily B protein